MSLESVFLKFSAEKLDQLCGRIETCADKLTPEQIWARGTQNENAVGNLMLHLAGNVRQWILHGVGGQPDNRVRDAEFDARGEISVDELKRRLRTTVDEASALIRALPPEHLIETRTIQKHYDVTVLEAIYHVVEHFSGHAGQIIFATKLLTGEDLGFYAYLRKAQAQSGERP
ncbi:MAG TPA: DinB family protein [Bryobacteraceae bacterium]|jgi:uncharacterized damage-inducible protein DinB|nr:DinB family protein [Bryobacteraceae bacterium]